MIPFVTSSGTGAESREALFTTFFGDMLVATIASLIFVPMLDYIIQRTAERKK